MGAAQLARQPDSWGAGGSLTQRSHRKEVQHWPVPAQPTGITKDNSVPRRLGAALIAYEEDYADSDEQANSTTHSDIPLYTAASPPLPQWAA